MTKGEWMNYSGVTEEAEIVPCEDDPLEARDWSGGAQRRNRLLHRHGASSSDDGAQARKLGFLFFEGFYWLEFLLIF